MKKTLIVTCVYSYLYGTDIGGRSSRQIHYLRSLVTLLNLEQDIVVYTSVQDKEFLMTDPRISDSNKIKMIIYDLYSDKNHQFYQKKIKEENITNLDRCYEIMHNKVNWINNHVNDGYDYIYWFDAGLNHGGLFPPKYRGGVDFDTHYNNSLMNPKVISNLNLSEKIVLLVGDRKNHIFDSVPSECFNIINENTGRYHVIGGMFGGNISVISELYKNYYILLEKMVECDILQREEHLLTLLYTYSPSNYDAKVFTTWHHEESDMAIINKENEVYFYSIFEELNK